MSQVRACKAQREEEEEGGEFVCPDDVPVGIFSKHAHPADCRQYFVCISGTPREYGCPLGTVFKIGEGSLDGKCTDPEEVPECANYYGDLDFDKQELVKAGVDPEAVGAKVIPARTRIQRPPVSRAKPAPEPIEDDEDDFILPAPVKPVVKAVTNSDSFRPSRPRVRPRPSITIENTPAPVRVAPPAPTRTRTRPSLIPLPEPVNARPAPPAPVVTEAPVVVAPPEPVIRAELPAIPLATLATEAPAPAAPAGPSLIPAVAASPAPAVTADAAPAGLGQPAKVKAGDDYYYYYYYYDDEYPEEGEGAATS